MDETLAPFKKDYSSALERYLGHPDESGLRAAYDLGRRALTEELNALDIAEVHHDELARALSGITRPDEVLGVAHSAAAFFTEALATFEMTRRGYFEAQSLYQRERNITETLQQSLLPLELARIGGVEIETIYQPGGLGNQVGGDFYDVFEAGDNLWGVMVGDVCGKGPKAAAFTALARHTVKAAAIEHEDPAEVLKLLNKAVLRYGYGDFCTLVYMLVRKLSRGVSLQVASGGHPLPYLVRQDGRIEQVRADGPLIGVLEHLDLNPATVELGPGDSIVLYTDGVIEARTPQGFFGEHGLVKALERCGGFDAAKIMGCISEALDEVEESARRDDMAILVLRVLPPSV